MSDKPGWIDFKQLRTTLKFQEVLDHYQVKVTVKGERATGFCPLPSHQGQRRSPSFSLHLPRGIWQCFGCHAKGNVLDFACRMEGFNPDDPKELRRAALKIRDIFRIDTTAQPSAKPAATVTSSAKVLVNPPIDFELRTLDPDHPYLKERGFMPETIKHFGLGYCNRGMLKGRAAIPLHNPQGQLVGYAGRLTKDAEISEQSPKYLFPGTREKDGVKLEFRKSLLLYNAHRIRGPVDHLFVVEGFPAAWALWQAEFRNAVALMGSSCSVEQGELIVAMTKPDGRVWVIPDGDKAGEQCAKSMFEHVSPHRFCRWMCLGKDLQPTDFPKDGLVRLLNYE
jgi:DNA primase